jgi:serine/threonine-protein kinase
MPVCPTCRTPSEEGVLICPVDGTRLTQGGGLVGRTIGGRYRILGRIGEGGMGTVYLCEHVALGKRMAVKVLRPEFSGDEELLRRFQHEARAASQIGQENIIDVFDFGHTAEGAAYFVMEALDGESLARLLQREQAVPLPRALPILMQICRALGAAHQRGIVHRDLKPENVFVTRREDGSEFVKVLDFGISKSARAPDGKRVTRAGSIIGTPEYMSPEQAAGTNVDHRSDVYAFGVLAYEMLTGRLPFQGETPLATLLKHQGEAPISPRRWRPELPVEVETLVMKALVKKPEGRQQSMAEVATDVTRAMAAIDLEPMHTPVFGTALSPLLTNQGTARFRRRPDSRGGTMALADTDPGDTAEDDVLRTTPPEGPRPSRQAAVPPAGEGARPRTETAPEMEALRRRRAQFVVAGVLGVSAVALLAAVVLAIAWRRDAGRAVDGLAAGPPPIAAPASPGTPPGVAAPGTGEAGPADPTAAAGAAPPILGTGATPGSGTGATPGSGTGAAPPSGIGSGAVAPSAPGPDAVAVQEVLPAAGGGTEPPPRKAASPAAKKGTRTPARRGVGAERRSGDNADPLNDIIDPYR